MSVNEIKIMLIGETGVGKSQLGNFLLQNNSFKVGDHDRSETKKISESSSKIENMNVTIIDTPGLNDTSGADEQIMNLIVEKFQNDKSIDGMILVYSFKSPRKVKKHQELLKNLITTFGEDLLKSRLKVIFTNCTVGIERDNIEEQKEKIQKEDTKRFLLNMVGEDDMIFLNSKMQFYKYFQQNIIDLFNNFLKIKRTYGSINKKIEKKELDFIEKKNDMNYNDTVRQISEFRTKISEAKQRIENLKESKSNAIVGTVLTSIMLPFTLGLSGVGVATTTVARNKINRQISQLEDDINYYNSQLKELEEIKRSLFRQFKNK